MLNRLQNNNIMTNLLMINKMLYSVNYIQLTDISKSLAVDLENS